jgi:phosphoribosylaminoimidazole carboxylase PurE protein
MKGLSKMEHPLVGVLMGSDSDWAVMSECCAMLEELGVAWEVSVISAHRTPDVAMQYAREAESRGLKALIAGAGGAAHLAGALAASTHLPVIGVPLDPAGTGGLDALLATVQMPAGVPVATVAVGKAGARNAAILAAQMIALGDAGLRERLLAYREKMRAAVADRSKKVQTEAQKIRKH